MNKSFDVKLDELVGRLEIKTYFEKALDTPGMEMVFLTGAGGIGKTRLLEYVQVLVSKRSQEETLLVGGLVDLYHFYYHDPERLMRELAEQIPLWESAFKDYRNGLDELETARLAGKNTLAARKLDETKNAFIKGLGKISKEKKVVLLLDTGENWIYTSDLERIDEEKWLIAPAWEWLKELAGTLENALIVFSGRDAIQVLEDNARQDELSVERKELRPFEAEDTKHYVNAITRKTKIGGFASEEIDHLHNLSQGSPILLAMYLEYYRLTPGSLLPSELRKDDISFDAEIIAMYMNQRELRDILPALGRAPKGVDEELLSRLLQISISEARYRLDEFKKFAFAKPHTLQDGRERMFLHDVLYDMLEKHVFSGDLLGKEKACKHISEYYETEIETCIAKLRRIYMQAMAASRPEQVATHDLIRWNTYRYALYAERVYYEFRKNLLNGQIMFGSYMHEAVSSHMPEGVMLLRTELATFLAVSKLPRHQKEGDHQRIFLESLLRLVPVEKALAEENYSVAVEQVEVFRVQIKQMSGLSGESLAVLLAILSTWQGSLKTRGKELEDAEKELKDALQELNRYPDVPQWLIWYQDFAFGLVYKYLGLLYVGQGRYFEALNNYQEALKYSRRTNLLIEEATIRNDLGFVIGEQGEFFEALQNVQDAYLIRRDLLGLGRYIGLGINTQAIIATHEGRFQEAVEFADKAVNLFNVLGDTYGKGLASIALAEATRRLAGSPHALGQTDKVEKLQAAERYAESAEQIFATDGNYPRLLETYLEIGCVNRDLIRRQRNLPIFQKNFLYRKSLDALQNAANIAEEYHFEYRLVDSLTNIAWLTYFSNRPENEIDQAIRDAEAKFPAEYKWSTDLGNPQINPKEANSLIWSQLGKLHVLKGVVARQRWLENDNKDELFTAAESFLMGLEYSNLFGKDYSGIRRAKNDIYNELKTLNEGELTDFSHAVSEAEKKNNFTNSLLREFMQYRGIWT